MQHVPLIKDIVLLGGGHTHALVVRRWGMKPLAGVRLSLVSRDVLTPYSGMLPGLVAGHYTQQQTHIDLARLCRWAGVRFIEGSVEGLDVVNNLVSITDRPALGFDVLSINTGSTPDTGSVAGAEEYVTPVKPVNTFSLKWSKLLQRVGESGAGSNRSLAIGVVGAGVGGFELLLAMRNALCASSLSAAAPSTSLGKIKLHWFVRGENPMNSQPAMVQQIAFDECRRHQITVHTGFDVDAVESDRVCASDGRVVELDEILWCTAASAPSWPAEAGLATTGNGFVSIQPTLQSTSHAHIFACGDVASLATGATEKSGVYAVRQAPALFANLRRLLLDEKLKHYHPQKNTLSLISLGDKSAIASRNGLASKSALFWRWKHFIDQRFMDKFTQLPERLMKTPELADLAPALQQANDPPGAGGGGASGRDHGLASLRGSQGDRAADKLMFCGGCGSKVGAKVLHQVLHSLGSVQRDEIVSGLRLTEDSSSLDAGNRLVVQSVDQFRSMIDDPFLFGRITALHALSDLFASGADPLSAQALITLPFSEADVQRRDLEQLMAGAVLELNHANCSLTGGHTSIGPELMLGFAVTGLQARPDEPGLPQTVGTAHAACGVAAGDALILTKPLGSGVVLAAAMRNKASGIDLRDVQQVMLQSNQSAAQVLVSMGVQQITDVTGFGLLGHLINLLQICSMDAELELVAMPIMPAALAYSAAGIRSSLYRHNEFFLHNLSGTVSAEQESKIPLLLDPQTNGGLLAIVPTASTRYCIDALYQQGIQGTVIGHLLQSVASDSCVSANGSSDGFAPKVRIKAQ